MVSGFCVRTRRRKGTEGPRSRRAEQRQEGDLEQNWDLWVRSCWLARIRGGLCRQVSIKALKIEKVTASQIAALGFVCARVVHVKFVVCPHLLCLLGEYIATGYLTWEIIRAKPSGYFSPAPC